MKCETCALMNLKMEIIKEESQDFRIEAVFSLKQEETEEQTGWFLSQSSTHSFDPVIK